jgi:hypothetical protein
MKHIRIRIIGSKHPPVQLQIQEGTRSCDVLAHLKAHLKLFSDSWVLAPASDSSTYFRSEEDLYDKVEDQDKLIVLSNYDAARITFNKLFPQSFQEGMKQ